MPFCLLGRDFDGVALTGVEAAKCSPNPQSAFGPVAAISGHSDYIVL